MPPQPKLLIHAIKDVTVVNFVDRLIRDLPQIEQIGEELFDLVDNRDRKKLVLDFSKVQGLSSQTLGILITLQQKARNAKGEVVLCGVGAELVRLFKIAGLQKLFKFCDNEDQALACFGVTSAG